MPDHDRAEDVVTCAIHGETAATFVCWHLASAESAGLGAHYDASSDEPWPAMVCTACAEEPEWGDEQAVERYRLLCTSCWEETFGKNTGARHPDPDQWLTDTAHRAERRQRQWAKDHRIHDAKQYRYELQGSAPWLGFGPSADRFEILCEPTVIGSWSKSSGTWLWGWANSWWSPSLTRPTVRVKRAGERLGVERLWRSGFHADEPLAWELCLATLELLPEFSGVYRSPDDTGALFLVIRNTRRVT